VDLLVILLSFRNLNWKWLVIKWWLVLGLGSCPVAIFAISWPFGRYYHYLGP